MAPDEILSQPANVLSQAQRECYFSEGYLFLENFLPHASLERLRTTAAELLEQSRDPSGCTADFEFEQDPGGGSPRVRQVLNPVDYHPELWAYASSAPVTELAADLVGPDVKSRESAMNYKPAKGAGGFKWHQDSAFYPSSDFSMLMVLTYLDEVTPDQGPTEVIPGIHGGELYDHHDDAGNWLGVMAKREVARLPTDRAVTFPCPAGSILITSSAIVHAAGRNASDRGRPVFLCGFQAADTFSYVEIPY